MLNVNNFKIPLVGVFSKTSFQFSDQSFPTVDVLLLLAVTG